MLLIYMLIWIQLIAGISSMASFQSLSISLQNLETCLGMQSLWGCIFLGTGDLFCWKSLFPYLNLKRWMKNINFFYIIAKLKNDKL